MAASHVFAEQILENSRRLWIESHHRLVDDNHVRLVNKSARDDELLSHAVAVTLDQLVAPLFQIEQRQQLSAPMLDVLPVLAVQSADESQKLDAGELLVDEGAI